MENTGKTHGKHRENTWSPQGKHREHTGKTQGFRYERTGHESGIKVFVLVNSTVKTSLVQMSKVKGQRSSLKVKGQGFISLEAPTSRDRSKKCRNQARRREG